MSGEQVNTQSTADLRCPSAAVLAQQLAQHAASAAQVMTDVMELADAAGATSLSIILDSHEHPQQSLLQAGLTELQGPALCFSIPGTIPPD